MTKVRSSESGVWSFSIISCILLAVLVSCGHKEIPVNEEFSAPEKTYKIWMNAGVEGDLVKSMECVTVASKRMMDQLVQGREEFMKRMVSSAAIFKHYSVLDKKISGSKAVIITESPDKKGRIAVPFLKEADGWKVDLVAMFGR